MAEVGTNAAEDLKKKEAEVTALKAAVESCYYADKWFD